MNQLIDLIKEQLKTYKKMKISLGELLSFVPAGTSYETAGHAIKGLMDEGVLIGVKSTGYTSHEFKLPNVFRVSKDILNSDLKRMIQRYVQTFSLEMNLDYYFKQGLEIWHEDLPYLQMINTYLNENTFPLEPATLPERSYWITGDEKWINEQGGYKILERLGLIEKMSLMTESEPAMFALSSQFGKKSNYKHLIVENKSIFYKILSILDKTCYTTLIYGAGWRISSSLKSFKKQFPFDDGEHIFLYFGDLDYEGIKIWDSLKIIGEVMPEKALYEALIDQKPSEGKVNQKKNNEAMMRFCEAIKFDTGLSEKLFEILENGRYIPQEALNMATLQTTLEGCNDRS